MRKALFILMCLVAMSATGTSLEAQEVTIVLNPGWTWISYPGTEPVDLVSALGSFTPKVGDIVASEWSASEYIGGEWLGDVDTFYPGYGYMYYSTRMAPVTLTFNAQQPVPQVLVTTSEPMLITAISAMGGGEVTVNDGTYIIVKGLCWATHENPTTNEDFFLEVGSGVGSFTVSMTDLNINTTYYVRAYAVTSNGIVYGDQKTFTTLDGIPILTTMDVTNINAISAYSGGTIDNCGLAISARGVCWSTSPNPTIADSHTTDGSGNGSFSSYITGLNVSTTYYVRAYATTTVGTGYGEQKTFTTGDGGGTAEGSGTFYDPYNVAAGIGLQNEEPVAWVHGYIVGAVKSGLNYVTDNADINWSAPFDNATNVVIANDASCNEISQCIIVNLPSGKPLRVQVNLMDNPGNLGKHLTVNGKLRRYFRQAGLRDSGGTENDFVLEGVVGDEHAYVDLGLPSGLLWATCNVGAETPEDYGEYFAWGETTPKSTYTWSNYQYCHGNYYSITKYCDNSSNGYNGFTDNLTTLLPEDDAATANWGDNWRMPTKEEWDELYNNTTVTWTTQNGVNGCLITASNGNSLFLPATGCRYYGTLFSPGSEGHYWSSSLQSGRSDYAWYFYFDLGDYCTYVEYRNYGKVIRPVRVGLQN